MEKKEGSRKRKQEGEEPADLELWRVGGEQAGTSLGKAGSTGHVILGNRRSWDSPDNQDTVVTALASHNAKKQSADSTTNRRKLSAYNKNL